MTTHQPLHLVPETIETVETIEPVAPSRRLRPEQRRRTVVAGRRPRVAVLAPHGAVALDPDALRMLAQVADVTFHRLDAAPDAATTARLLRDVDVLASTSVCLPMLDEAALATLPSLRAVVLRSSGRTTVTIRHLPARALAGELADAVDRTAALLRPAGGRAALPGAA